MDKLPELFFQQTLRHWHFEALVQESGLSRERVHFYLKQLIQKKLIQRIKPRRKMPYYRSNIENPAFRMEKRLFGLQLLEQSRLFQSLQSNQAIITAIIFGSFARGDWSQSSDVDLFIYGDDTYFNQREVEQKLGRSLQVFSFQDPHLITEELEPALITNIIKGFNIKGTVEPFEVFIHA